MKRNLLLIGLAVSASLSAQNYKLTDMSAETFAAGGDAQWSFEKYAYETGVYSKLSTYTDKSTCNYLDIYQPERVGGQLITEIEGVEPAGEFTWASNLRWAWCDQEFTTDVRTNSLENFIYVAQDPREGFGYETIGNDTYTSVITFTVPEDGFYKVDGTVIRQDGDEWIASLDIVPRFRYGFDAQDAGLDMGMAFNYGAVSGILAEYDGVSGSLANGAAQKFVAQAPTDFTMAFSAKAGDKISFEVNTEKMNGAGGDWGHGWWSRTFFRRLDVEKVDEASAKAVEGYVDAYGQNEVEKLWEVLEAYEEQTFDMVTGTEYGEYGQAEYDSLMAVIADIVMLSEDDLLFDLNYQQCLDRLNEAWRLLQLSKIVIDYTCEGNYLLFAKDEMTGVINRDQTSLDTNNGEPWEFSWYDVNTGSYTLFTNHDTKSKFGSDSIAAWYKGTGDWLYISDDGNIHPTTVISPAIVFVAPETGVYKFEFACYRANPNPNVKESLWIRSRFLKAGTTSIPKEEFIFAKEYGSVDNDGQGGKAPISLNFYVSMQQGDRVTFEEDCYTNNRNSSAGTQVTRLAACSRANEDSVFTAEAVRALGFDLYDPYGVGDPAVLIDAIAYADSIMNVHKDNIGVDGGQYSIVLYTTLGDYIAEARVLIEGESSQAELDRWANDIITMADRFATSRNPYEVILTGQYKINIVDTEKYITQKNSAGDHFYAAIADSAAIIADAEKNSVDLSVYKQLFTFTQPYGTSATVITSEDGYMTLDGYVIPGEDTTAVHTFTIYKYEMNDEACCILRSDNLYWNGSYTWKSPYDKMNTTETPSYIFRFESIEESGIMNPENNGVIVATEYFTLSGIRIMNPEKGLVIRRRTLEGGMTLVDKYYIK